MNIQVLHAPLWQRLQAWRTRLPHALLLTGYAGIGKRALAEAFAGALLCEQPKPGGEACGQCLACGWYAQGNHPDFRLLQPEALAVEAGEAEEGKKKASQQITVDQVRELDDYFAVGTHRGGLRIVLIHPVEAMNRSTANSLLKTLEEPPRGTLFLLVSNEPMRLLATIRSRCQMLPVPLPSAEAAAQVLQEQGVTRADDWLALAGGAPFAALELAQSGLGAGLEALVQQLAAGKRGNALAGAAVLDKLIRDSKGKLLLRHLLDWSQKWSFDLMAVSQDLALRYFLPQQATMRALVKETAMVHLVRYNRSLLAKRREVEQPLNARLFLETFLLDYQSVFR